MWVRNSEIPLAGSSGHVLNWHRRVPVCVYVVCALMLEIATSSDGSDSQNLPDLPFFADMLPHCWDLLLQSYWAPWSSNREPELYRNLCLLI